MRFSAISILPSLLAALLLFLPASANEEVDCFDRGKKVFEANMCIECHKDGGNMVRPSKPIKGEKFSKKYKDDEKLISVIRAGVYNTSMPSFGPAVISDSDMKDLIFYVRGFSKTEKPVSKTVGKGKEKEKGKGKGK